MKISRSFVLLLSLLLLSACAPTTLMDKQTGIDLVSTGQDVYTLVNLHPDEIQAKLYSVNYQREGLIAACTQVDIIKLERKRLTFKVLDTDKVYTLDQHKSTPDFPAYLQKYFGTECVTPEIEKLSAIDQRGIKEGSALQGMTKQGVIYAIGYPPGHRTPSLKSNEWIYWQSRFSTIIVVFDAKGKVVEVRRSLWSRFNKLCGASGCF